MLCRKNREFFFEIPTHELIINNPFITKIYIKLIYDYTKYIKSNKVNWTKIKY